MKSFIYFCCWQVGEVSVQEHTGETEPIAVMRALRTEKDNFKPKQCPNWDIPHRRKMDLQRGGNGFVPWWIWICHVVEMDSVVDMDLSSGGNGFVTWLI